jgi:hypothetical protein
LAAIAGGTDDDDAAALAQAWVEGCAAQARKVTPIKNERGRECIRKSPSDVPSVDGKKPSLYERLRHEIDDKASATAGYEVADAQALWKLMSDDELKVECYKRGRGGKLKNLSYGTTAIMIEKLLRWDFGIV